MAVIKFSEGDRVIFALCTRPCTCALILYPFLITPTTRCCVNNKVLSCCKHDGSNWFIIKIRLQDHEIAKDIFPLTFFITDERFTACMEFRFLARRFRFNVPLRKSVSFLPVIANQSAAEVYFMSGKLFPISSLLWQSFSSVITNVIISITLHVPIHHKHYETITGRSLPVNNNFITRGDWVNLLGSWHFNGLYRFACCVTARQRRFLWKHNFAACVTQLRALSVNRPAHEAYAARIIHLFTHAV